MTTKHVTRIILAPRERQVLEGLAAGASLPVVANDLKIREGTAAGYLKNAKRKLHGVNETPAAVAVAYATEAIVRPELRDPETLFLPREQRVLVPLIARGLTAAQMVTELTPKPKVDIIRRDCRELRVNLQALNRAHLVTRAWEFQILNAEQVIAWLR
ncbi:LuxR C-terminal-related transcriptional regulator [Streptomyces rectiviolaceus]|uniref:HTH luxR-type domain-containing protein n=1 Tax=Streptomyces rectiviolaceus TaxID=332591 RepID=A0ABP6M6D7_9ACTN